MKFTPSQLEAILHPEGNLQLIACAGSGKTEVVARRIATLLRPGPCGGLKPRNIVAFTFTEKAAAELKERIVTRCREELGDIPGFAEMYVGTIHAFCLDLLKNEVPRYFKFDVLNEVQQRLFVDRHSRKSGLTASTSLKGETLKRYVDTSRYCDALSILRESAIDPKALAGCSVFAALGAYRNLLEERSHFDYSEILAAAADALQNDHGMRKRLSKRIRHVVIDEYQDVNPVQERIVSCLHGLGAKICVVGDDDQTIYQWRGSDVSNILTFQERYPGVHMVRLEDNFRSTRGIVETARALIEKNGLRLEKAMKPTGAQEYEAGDIAALAFDTPEDEARYIAETAISIRGVAIRDGDVERGISWSDMAVLLRSVRRNGAPITQAFDAAGIPYVIAGMGNLFDTAEAEAARQLFYFMAGRPEVDVGSLEAAWSRARTGATRADLLAAIQAAASVREEMRKDGGKRFAFYSIQRRFLSFLEDAGIREERVPDGRGEIVFYNLGKFSQVISDFEAIHYHSEPVEKHHAFASFLQYQAEHVYPEGWQDNAYANPDAIRIMTVHQAKGMQWPMVFVPALVRNRFPSKKQGGPSVWHLIPAAGIERQARFEGTVEDERRLFYVAVTRSQTFLHLTWAPVPGNRLYQKASELWEDVLVSKWVKRRRPDYAARERLPPTPRKGVTNVALSFSELKYFFECPYQFKLRILYGFNAPLHEALGYGKSLHDILAEVHARAIRGDIATAAEVPRLVDTHLCTPYAYPDLREKLKSSAERVIHDYLEDNRDRFDKIEFSEKSIEINLGDGVSIVGRIDLVRRVDTGETTIVDLKSSDRAQPEEIIEKQLHIYALGYQELTGRSADFVEVYNLDERKQKPRAVDDSFIDEVKTGLLGAADALRKGSLQAKPAAVKCRSCDYLRLCTEGGSATAVAPKRGLKPRS
ncbi:ATP-dependent helicase [Sorangium sp. So ce426]|uniref:ATP-dependent helicase n=1 Tax=Sorangium sp. So ce426 TaxID=3133312 RepID=UPI003F5AE7CE